MKSNFAKKSLLISSSNFAHAFVAIFFAFLDCPLLGGEFMGGGFVFIMS